MADIIEAIEQVRPVLGDMPLEAFEAEWEKQWLVERGVEIISEAGHHLPDDLKIRNPEIPWKKAPASATCCATITRASRLPSCGSWRTKISLISSARVPRTGSRREM